ERKRLLLLVGSHARHALAIGRAAGIRIAKELHETAERNPRDLPQRSLAVVPFHDRRAEADGECVYPYPAPAADGEVTKLVKEYENGDEKEDGGKPQREPAKKAVKNPKHRSPSRNLYAASLRIAASARFRASRSIANTASKLSPAVAVSDCSKVFSTT